MSQHIINTWKSQVNAKAVSLYKAIEKLKAKPNYQKAEDLHQKVFSEMDCLQCANCCKTIPPIVSRRDTKRIAKHLGMRPSEFERIYLRMDEDGDRVFKQSPCSFLEEDNRCRIYEVRPSACRAYPHSGDFDFFNHTKLHKRNFKYCPALFEIARRMVEDDS
jgi:Fe-S-cluster containining protein